MQNKDVKALTFAELKDRLVNQSATIDDIDIYEHDIQKNYPAIGAHYETRGGYWNSFGDWLLNIQAELAQGDLVDDIPEDDYPTLMQIDQALRARFYDMERSGIPTSKIERDLIGYVSPWDTCKDCGINAKSTPSGSLLFYAGYLLVCEDCANA